MRRLAPDNIPLLALSFPESDDDAIPGGKVCHHNLFWLAVSVAHEALSPSATRRSQPSTVNQAPLPLVDQDVGGERRAGRRVAQLQLLEFGPGRRGRE